MLLDLPPSTSKRNCHLPERPGVEAPNHPTQAGCRTRSEIDEEVTASENHHSFELSSNPIALLRKSRREIGEMAKKNLKIIPVN
jgi:hypothetical protein